MNKTPFMDEKSNFLINRTVYLLTMKTNKFYIIFGSLLFYYLYEQPIILLFHLIYKKG